MNVITKTRNALHPGYGQCFRCGGNWGRKEPVDHNIKADGSRSLFLFCKECDKKVTLEERWIALDAWKAETIRQYGRFLNNHTPEQFLQEIKSLLETEFVEFPRKND